MLRFTPALPLLLSLAACAVGQAQVEVTETHDATFPGVARGASDELPASSTESTNVGFDVSSTIASWGSYGKLSAVVSQDELTGPGLAVVRHVSAAIAPASHPSSALPLAEADVPPGSTHVALAREMDDAVLFGLLEQGPVVLKFTITGPLSTEGIVLQHTLVAQVDLAVAASL